MPAGCDLRRHHPGETITFFFAIKDDLIYAGATYQDAGRGGGRHIITSRPSLNLPVFCQAIITFLSGEVRCPTCQTVLFAGHPWD